jgi:hypothetical protein
MSNTLWTVEYWGKESLIRSASARLFPREHPRDFRERTVVIGGMCSEGGAALGAVTLTLGVGPAMNCRCAISHITATAFQLRSSSMAADTVPVPLICRGRWIGRSSMGSGSNLGYSGDEHRLQKDYARKPLRTARFRLWVLVV